MKRILTTAVVAVSQLALVGLGRRTAALRPGRG